MSEDRSKSAARKPLDHAKIEADHLMTVIHYVKVKSMTGGNTMLMVRDVDRAMDFGVHGLDLVKSMQSADLFSETRAVTRTEMAETLSESFNRPLTVKFTTQKGEARTLRGRLVRPERIMGRSMCEDLDKPDPKDRVRLVDHRTLEELIVDGVRYTLK